MVISPLIARNRADRHRPSHCRAGRNRVSAFVGNSRLALREANLARACRSLNNNRSRASDRRSKTPGGRGDGGAGRTAWPRLPRAVCGAGAPGASGAQLGDLFGLTNFGVNLTRLPPGGSLGVTPYPQPRGRIHLHCRRRAGAGDQCRRDGTSPRHVRRVQGRSDGNAHHLSNRTTLRCGLFRNRRPQPRRHWRLPRRRHRPRGSPPTARGILCATTAPPLITLLIAPY